MWTSGTRCLHTLPKYEHGVSKLGCWKTLVYSVTLVFMCRSNIACMLAELNFVRAMFSLVCLIRWLKGIYVRERCLAMIYLSADPEFSFGIDLLGILYRYITHLVAAWGLLFEFSEFIWSLRCVRHLVRVHVYIVTMRNTATNRLQVIRACLCYIVWSNKW